MKKEKPLTTREQKFVEYYSGNAIDAAKKAGYTGTDNTISVTAHRLLRKPKIKDAIRQREKTEKRPHIMNRQERQAFWTKVAQDSNEDMRNRIRASELLGKSEADFTANHNVKGEITIEDLVHGANSDE